MKTLILTIALWLIILLSPLSLIWLLAALKISVVFVVLFLFFAVFHQWLSMRAAVQARVVSEGSQEGVKLVRVAAASSVYVSCVTAIAVGSQISGILIEQGLVAGASWMVAIPAILLTVPLAFTLIITFDVILYPVVSWLLQYGSKGKPSTTDSSEVTP